jgi:hypothetical protein
MPNHLHSILVLRERARHAVPLLNSEEQLNGSKQMQLNRGEQRHQEGARRKVWRACGRLDPYHRAFLQVSSNEKSSRNAQESRY